MRNIAAISTPRRLPCARATKKNTAAGKNPTTGTDCAISTAGIMHAFPDPSARRRQSVDNRKDQRDDVRGQHPVEGTERIVGKMAQRNAKRGGDLIETWWRYWKNSASIAASAINDRMPFMVRRVLWLPLGHLLAACRSVMKRLRAKTLNNELSVANAQDSPAAVWLIFYMPVNLDPHQCLIRIGATSTNGVSASNPAEAHHPPRAAARA